ncbi:MAG TPA: GH116 family glycosyl hydrolase [Candidatus Acidoferrales bacterium]|nr:GH116 family glycosyl hydrolase [Candidatus Acidoferrales bacterium]
MSEQAKVSAMQDWIPCVDFFLRTAWYRYLMRAMGAVLIAAAISWACGSPAAAQSAKTLESGLELRTQAQPGKYFDATGRKAAVFGTQNGQFEAWIYPIKLLHGFRLEFQQEGMLEPVRGETLLQQVVTRPEATTLVYVHPNFTVREMIWAPLDEPGIVVQFDVDTEKPLDITAAFVPDFKPMWPASFGGQHSYWIAGEKAFALTDGRETATALIGSPFVSGATDFTDHQLMTGEMLMRMHVTPEQARSSRPVLAMALSVGGEEEARKIYRGLLEHAGELLEKRVEYEKEFLSRTLSIETPDEELNRDFTWAKVALDSGWVCNAEYGCGLIAGYGPSGAGERPGFAWWFGGDALMTSWAMEDYGDFNGALGALRFLKARQRSDGKMMHEMSQSAGLVDWFGKYGFAYYHADTTPMYLYSLGEYWNHTGDKKLLDEVWDSAKKAYAYCVSTLDPNDGLMDNTKAGLAAVEVGVLKGRVVKDIYLQGFWLGGLESMEKLAEAEGDSGLAADAKMRLAKAKESIEKQWWNPDGNYFAFGLGADGQRADMIGTWPAVMLGISSAIDEQRAAEETARLASPELATDWGIRWLSNKSPLYDSVSYNNGTVWPFMNTFASWAEYLHGDSLAGFSAWSETARLTGIQSPGTMPEHMNGDRYLPGERSVPHQLFSSVGVVVPAVRGLLGLSTSADVNAQGGTSSKVSFYPRLPADWRFLRFSKYAAGTDGTQLSGEVRQEKGMSVVKLKSKGIEEVSVHVWVPIPLLARVRRVSVNGKNAKFQLMEEGDSKSAAVDVLLREETEIAAEYDGGVGIVPPVVEPEPGERAAGLKVMRVAAASDNSLDLTLAGMGGHSYMLDLVTTLPTPVAEGARVTKTDTGYTLEIPFEGTGYVQRVIQVKF